MVSVSEILSHPLGHPFRGESWFMFSLMTLLVQPLPAALVWPLSAVSLFQKILNTPLGIIFYTGLTGSTQWYLIGFGIMKPFKSKVKPGILDWLIFSILLCLALAMITYTLSLFFGLDGLRPQAERYFFLLWAVAAVILLIGSLRFILRFGMRAKIVPGSEGTG